MHRFVLKSCLDNTGQCPPLKGAPQIVGSVGTGEKPGGQCDAANPKRTAITAKNHKNFI